MRTFLPVFDISLPAFQNARKSGDMRHLYVHVCVGMDPVVAPTIAWHLPKRDTRPQGYEGTRAQQRPSFSQASGPLGDRAGSGLMGFADVCCWSHSLKASSLVWVRCTIINNVNWKKTASWTLSSEVMHVSTVNALIFGVLFNTLGRVFRELLEAGRIRDRFFSHGWGTV